MIGSLLLDNSAWARLNRPGFPPSRATELAAAVDRGELVVCMPFLLEAGYSARTAEEHAALFDRLLTLPRIAVDKRVEDRALDAQRQLARAGHHRLAPVDLLIAALADRYGLGVLHYDADFEVILSRTDLAFHSEWLAMRGSL